MPCRWARCQTWKMSSSSNEHEKTERMQFWIGTLYCVPMWEIHGFVKSLLRTDRIKMASWDIVFDTWWMWPDVPTRHKSGECACTPPGHPCIMKMMNNNWIQSSWSQPSFNSFASQFIFFCCFFNAAYTRLYAHEYTAGCCGSNKKLSAHCGCVLLHVHAIILLGRQAAHVHAYARVALYELVPLCRVQIEKKSLPKQDSYFLFST